MAQGYLVSCQSRKPSKVNTVHFNNLMVLIMWKGSQICLTIRVVANPSIRSPFLIHEFGSA